MDPIPLPNLIATCEAGLAAASAYEAAVRNAVRAQVAPAGRVEPALLEGHQFAAHGLSWIATYVEALRQCLDWARRLASAAALGERESLILQAAFGEYLAQLQG